MSKSANLNCIDLSDPDIQKSVFLLKQACKDSVFLYVINHGISKELMDEVFAQSKKFFDLPLDEKMKVLRNEKHRGYTPIFDELYDPEKQITGDYKEGYYIGVETHEDDSRSQKPFFGPNRWPSSAFFVEPNHECLVECLPTCKEDTNPPKFPSIPCHIYLSQRLQGHSC